MRVTRGQGAVEYLIVLVFLVGFIVSVLVPSVREGEVSVALASARAGALNYTAAHPDVRLLALNYSVQGDRVTLEPQVYNASLGGEIAPPDGLSASMLAAIARLSPGSAADGTCAYLSNYDYCVAGPP